MTNGRLAGQTAWISGALPKLPVILPVKIPLALPERHWLLMQDIPFRPNGKRQHQPNL